MIFSHVLYQLSYLGTWWGATGLAEPKKYSPTPKAENLAVKT